jgi:protein-disulfide isomerase
VKRIAIVVLLLLGIGGLAVVVYTPGSRAQVNLTMETSMTKGATSAKVTIVEFSDYQ